MGIFYHGSAVKGLVTLNPHRSPFSNLDYECVYLTSIQSVAAIYIWNKPFKWMSYDILDHGIPMITESFSNHLYEFYNGVEGCIYTCEGNFITDYDINIRFAAVSKVPVKVKETDFVTNAYERLLQYESEGKLIIRRFADLPQEVHDGRARTVLRTIQNLNLLAEKHPMAPFIKEKFPELWEQAKREI